MILKSSTPQEQLKILDINDLVVTILEGTMPALIIAQENITNEKNQTRTSLGLARTSVQKLEPRILLEDTGKSYHASQRVFQTMIFLIIV